VGSPAEIDAASIGEALAAHGARPWQIETTAGIAGAFVESVQTTEAASDLAS
jgi:ribonuclease D